MRTVRRADLRQLAIPYHRQQDYAWLGRMFVQRYAFVGNKSAANHRTAGDIMTPLYFDDLAGSLIARRLAKHLSAALLLDIQKTYSRAGTYCTLRLDWTTRERAERRASLECCGCPEGVPIYMPARLFRYLAWRPLRVHGLRLGPFCRLVPEAGPFFVEELREWEQSHPQLGNPARPAA